MNIYVGNLSYDSDEEEIKQEFAAFGEVGTVNIIRDKYSGRSRGFGFVEMPTEDEGKAAITAMNGKTLKGRQLVVNEARSRPERA